MISFLGEKYYSKTSISDAENNYNPQESRFTILALNILSYPQITYPNIQRPENSFAFFNIYCQINFELKQMGHVIILN